MITNDAMEVHFGLRLLEKVADHTYCHNYPRVNQARELRHLQCLSSNTSVKWMKLGCVVPAFPLGP